MFIVIKVINLVKILNVLEIKGGNFREVVMGCFEDLEYIRWG